MRTVAALLVLASLFLLYTCTTRTETPLQAPEVETDVAEKIFIVDRTGKKWDITHAVNHYGFKSERFQYGLGPEAIPPILNPRHFEPGDPDYPPDNAPTIVLGVAIGDDARAYPLNVMYRHEVVNERFAARHLAVAY